jgi:acetate kinase
VYLHRLGAVIGAWAAALAGLDAIVFTGGVGEHSGAIRLRAADGLGFLGIQVDATRNARAPDAEIGVAESAVRLFVIEAREDLQIAREVRSTI